MRWTSRSFVPARRPSNAPPSERKRCAFCRGYAIEAVGPLRLLVFRCPSLDAFTHPLVQQRRNRVAHGRTRCSISLRFDDVHGLESESSASAHGVTDIRVCHACRRFSNACRSSISLRPSTHPPPRYCLPIGSCNRSYRIFPVRRRGSALDRGFPDTPIPSRPTLCFRSAVLPQSFRRSEDFRFRHEHVLNECAQNIFTEPYVIVLAPL